MTVQQRVSEPMDAAYNGAMFMYTVYDIPSNSELLDGTLIKTAQV